MIINNWFKDGIMKKNNTKWNNSGEREIMINDKENLSCTELNEKLFLTRTNSMNSDTYRTPNNHTSTTMNSSGSSSCDNSQQHLTPKRFLEKYSLPRVIKIIPQEPIADSCGNFDPITLLSGQLLMYKHYHSGKIEARSFPNDKNDYSSLFMIPETYKGWFSVVTERGQIKARVYSSIQRLVAAQVTIFLSVSQDLVAYMQTNSDEISVQYTKTSVKSGQVLKLLAVYQDLNSNQSTKSKRLSWPLIGSKQHTSRYAQCLSSSNQVLFINFNTPGQFYAVSTNHNSAEENVTKVYQIHKLLRTFPLPVRVTIIGSNKNHGSMLLENYHKEHVVLSCVLDRADVTTNENTSEKFRLLEIDVNSKFYVVKPGGRDVDERRLFYSPLVQRAMKFCNDNSEQWISQLKVIHHIYPQNANQLLPNQQQNVSMGKSKKIRKTSICDKITVKSASFRFSTSYGNEIARPFIAKQDLENANKPKVYDFNYKQTHDFVSLSSNATKDTNSSFQNSLHTKEETMPDVSYDRYVRSNTRASQDSRGNQKPFGLPFSNGSNQSTGENSRDRIQFRYSNNHGKDHNQETMATQDTSNKITSLPTKNYVSQDSKHASKVSSLPRREAYVHENRRPTKNVQNHHYSKHNGLDENKISISRSSPVSIPILPEQNSFKSNKCDSPKEEISPVERLDRLTKSCNLLSLLNKSNNGYQNVSSNNQNKTVYKPDHRRDMDGKQEDYDTDSSEDSDETNEYNRQTSDNLTRPSEDPIENHKQNKDSVAQGNAQENLSLQHLQLNRTPSSTQHDSSKFKFKSNDSPTVVTHAYKSSSNVSFGQKTKTPEQNSFAYIHRQETPERKNDNKPISNQFNVFRSNSSRNSSQFEHNHLARNQNFNQHFTPVHTSTSSHVSSNSSQYSNQNIRTHVSRSSTVSSQSNPNTNYLFNQNRSVSSNVSRASSVKPSLPPPIKTHNKTPVPIPRLDISYAKVHDAIDEFKDDASASSENIYAEISDR